MWWGGGSPSSQNKEAYFIDSAVEGVEYVCGSTTGVTDSNGKFIYNAENCPNGIEFTLAALKLGVIKPALLSSDGYLTPQELAGTNRENVTQEGVYKIALLLQSLDEDGDAKNGIKITDDIKSKISLSGAVEDVDIEDIEDEIVTLGKTPKDIHEVIEHLLESTKARDAAMSWVSIVPDDFSLEIAQEASSDDTTYLHPITISGSTVPTIVTVQNAEYSLDGGTTWTNKNQAVQSGQEVHVRYSSSQTQDVKLTIGTKERVLSAPTTQACTASVCPVNITIVGLPKWFPKWRPKAEIYISSAIYDSNATADGGDDILYVYFNTDINSSTLASDIADSFTLNGGVLSGAATVVYEAEYFHKLTISLNATGSQNPIDISDANISLIQGGIRDTDGNYPQDINETVIQKLQVVKKTGQIKSYDASSAEVTDSSLADDGLYQKGKIPRYTRDATHDTVTDELTGLMWQDDASAASTQKPWLTSANFTTCSNNQTSPACYDTSGDTAASYCSERSLGGHTDWRLPTVEELEGIVDYGKVNPAIDTTSFNNISSSRYWSSTTLEYGKNGVEYSKNLAWYVYFKDGDVVYYGKGGNRYVRCVRAGQ